MTDHKTLTGGCLCGATRYEASGTPGLTLICHCRMCQRVSGGPFMGILFLPTDAVRVTKGEPHLYPASPSSRRHFCGNCGSPLFFERHARGITGLTVGSLDEAYDFKPQMHICTESAMAWLDINDDVPRHTRKPEGMTPPMAYDPRTGQTGPDHEGTA